MEEELMYLTGEEKRRLHELYTKAIQHHSSSDKIDMDANKRVKRYVQNIRRLIEEMSFPTRIPDMALDPLMMEYLSR